MIIGKKYFDHLNPLVPRTASIGPASPDAIYVILPVLPYSQEDDGSFNNPLEIRWIICHELSHGPFSDSEKVLKHFEKKIRKVMYDTSLNGFLPNVPHRWRFTEIFIRAVQVLYLREHEGEKAVKEFIEHEKQNYGIEIPSEWAEALQPYYIGRIKGEYSDVSEYLPSFLEEVSNR